MSAMAIGVANKRQSSSARLLLRLCMSRRPLLTLLFTSTRTVRPFRPPPRSRPPALLRLSRLPRSRSCRHLLSRLRRLPRSLHRHPLPLSPKWTQRQPLRQLQSSRLPHRLSLRQLQSSQPTRRRLLPRRLHLHLQPPARLPHSHHLRLRPMSPPSRKAAVFYPWALPMIHLQALEAILVARRTAKLLATLSP